MFYKFVAKKFKKIYKTINFISWLFPRYINEINVMFLRKTNTFIKSKYSKNRQWSKSIVYFGLWFGVISAFTIIYYTYKYMFIFSYMWWAGALIPSLIVIGFLIKHYKFLGV